MNKWLTEEDIEELYKSNSKLADEIWNYLHGKCDEWVLEHYKDGDIAVIWDGYNFEIDGVSLIHCYIKRGNTFIDVRGETKNESDIEEGFEYDDNDNAKLYCKSLKEYKEWIRKIFKYKDSKWK